MRPADAGSSRSGGTAPTFASTCVSRPQARRVVVAAVGPVRRRSSCRPTVIKRLPSSVRAFHPVVAQASRMTAVVGLAALPGPDRLGAAVAQRQAELDQARAHGLPSPLSEPPQGIVDRIRRFFGLVVG